jgi:hypothetical protein
MSIHKACSGCVLYAADYQVDSPTAVEVVI